MRFLLDQDVYAITANFLQELGHSVLTAADLGMSRAKDIELLQTAKAQNRILVTRDRDFGSLVFIENLRTGVIYLRFPYHLRQAGHLEMKKVLAKYSENELKQAFIVLEPGRHRFRRLQL